MMHSDHMLVIGAGPVGLAVAKSLQAHGIPYHQIEADSGIGGNWRHGVFDTTHIISSRKTTEYPDFPMPDSYPDFPSRHQMLDYLKAYADEFDLQEFVECDTKVSALRPCEDDRWEVELEDGERRTYKGIVACTGHHWDRRWPTYPGEFTGEWIHSKDYKSPEQLRGKRVLVIGGGNSACDVAVDAARAAKSSHISMRQGHWFMPKTMLGIPTTEIMRPWMPVWLQRMALGSLLRIIVGDYRKYGLERPSNKIFDDHPTINSGLLYQLKHGKIVPHVGVSRLRGEFVEFEDGTREAFDMVVCATGYHVSFPYLPEGLLEVRKAVPQLYAGCALEDYKNLYVVGSLQLRYGFGPLITPYAEFLAKVIKVQDRMELPIGRVAKRMGDRIPQSHLLCPFQALRGIRRAERVFPLMILQEKQMRRSEGEFINTPVPFVRRDQSASELNVY